jgi:hypothetical protein
MCYFARSGSVTRILSGQTRRVTDPARARITLETFGKHHWYSAALILMTCHSEE